MGTYQINKIKFNDDRDYITIIQFPSEKEYELFRSLGFREKDCAKNNKLKIFIEPNAGKEFYKELYTIKHLKDVDKVFDETLKELGISLKKAHLLTCNHTLKKNGQIQQYYYEGIKKYTTNPRVVFQDRLEKNLRKANVTLSFYTAISPKYKIKIGGNASGIASSYTSFVWSTPWQDCQMNVDELKAYLQANKGKIKCYTLKHYDLYEINSNRVLETKFGTTSEHRGIGSQASDAVTTVKLQKDSYGNLLIDSYTLIYD